MSKRSFQEYDECYVEAKRITRECVGLDPGHIDQWTTTQAQVETIERLTTLQQHDKQHETKRPRKRLTRIALDSTIGGTPNNNWSLEGANWVLDSTSRIVPGPNDFDASVENHEARLESHLERIITLMETTDDKQQQEVLRDTAQSQMGCYCETCNEFWKFNTVEILQNLVDQ